MVQSRKRLPPVQLMRERMTRPLLHSIRFKASALVTLLVILVTCLGTTVSVRETRRAMYGAQLKRVQESAGFLAAHCVREVGSSDHESLQHVAREVISSHRGLFIVFADADGDIIASSERSPGFVQECTDAAGRLRRERVGESRLVEVADAPLAYAESCLVVTASKTGGDNTAKDRILGYIRLGIDASDTRANLAGIARKYFTAGIELVLLLVPLALVLTQRVLAPVGELARTAHAIANGSMDARANVDTRDEIGELATSFNRMAERVTESQLELIKLNSELEQRVAQRTHELAELASRDPLTGLYNRRYFGEVITREFAAAERYGDDMTVLMFDVDRFKEINDKFGHRTGDAVLISIAMAISGELRGSDVAARFGGDEFILLLPQTEVAAAANLAERISASFERELAIRHPGIATTLSIGAASIRTTRARSSEALIHEADVALYAAKQGGRNRIVEARETVASA